MTDSNTILRSLCGDVDNPRSDEAANNLLAGEDYKTRFQVEYYQLYHRLRRLRKMLDDNDNGKLDFELSCPVSLLEEQVLIMDKYLRTLELRSILEGIDLGLNL